MERYREERGASAIEFALVASLLFLILFGIVQFGIAFNRLQGLHAASREGARAASLPNTTVSEIESRVRNSVSIIDPNLLASGCPTTTLATGHGCIDIAPSGSPSFKPCDLRSGQDVTVTVKYRGAIDIPFWSNTAVTMKGLAKYRCE